MPKAFIRKDFTTLCLLESLCGFVLHVLSVVMPCPCLDNLKTIVYNLWKNVNMTECVCMSLITGQHITHSLLHPLPKFPIFHLSKLTTVMHTNSYTY